ncbi:hypothetical protein E2C01_010662 [Portunus trituberculatus]|uniref:Uncharacterized protein n=1 Tax=Portunus trituberculatus TaxID=210409 RepID=A0A5B7D9C6_PORTR|nr:hypothetical protein [Portunus trituberculatus]
MDAVKEQRCLEHAAVMDGGIARITVTGSQISAGIRAREQEAELLYAGDVFAPCRDGDEGA